MKDLILKEWEESIGDLTDLKDDGFVITLEFTTIWSVEVPRMTKDLIKKFKGMVGARIGVLRTDIPGKEILVREIKRKKIEEDVIYE